MPIKKLTARSLIRYIQKVEFGGHVHDPNAKSMFEFARQLSSRHMKKANPKLDWNLKYFAKPGKPYIKVVYANGDVFETDTLDITAGALREEVFLIAQNIELDYETSGNNPIVGENDEDELIVRATSKK